MAQEKVINIKYFTDIDEIKEIGIGDWIDLRAAEDVDIPVGEYKLIPLGVAMQLPDGYEAHVLPRSSTFKNYGIIMTNSQGIIDNSYRGDNDQWYFPAYALRANSVTNGRAVCHINKNDRICQFRIMEIQPSVHFEEFETFDTESRGGFGSTGRR